MGSEDLLLDYLSGLLGLNSAIDPTLGFLFGGSIFINILAGKKIWKDYQTTKSYITLLRDVEPLLTSIINKKSHFKPAEIEEAIRIKGKIKEVLEK